MRATTLLVTDGEDKMCWRQLRDVDDDSDRFRHHYPPALSISVGHQPENCNKHKVINIHLSPKSM